MTPRPSCVKSHLAKRMLEALAVAPATSAQLAESCAGTVSSCNTVLLSLLIQRKVHVHSWARVGHRGPYSRVYAAGDGVDAERPKPLTNASKCRKWRMLHYERKTDRRIRKPLTENAFATLLGL